nr:SonD [Paraconiothyrium archidendri]
MADVYTNNATNFVKPTSFLGTVAHHVEVDWDNGRQFLLLGTGLLVAAFYIIDAARQAIFSVKAPVIGYKHWWEPGWVIGMRFAKASGPMVREGYTKVRKALLMQYDLLLTHDQFKDSMFKIRRNDADILVISHKFVNELRDVHENDLNPMEAHLKNIVAPYTVGNIKLLRNSDLHRRTIQKKLTPSLGTLIPPIKDELDYAMDVVMPECADWKAIHINEIFVKLVARVSARIFVGPALCRNEEWLATSIQFTKNVGMTRNMVRILPTFLRPFLAPTMKSYWGIYSNLKTAKALIVPIIRDRRNNLENNPKWEKPNDFLQWMIDDARPDEGSEHDLAHRQLMIGLAAIQTTSMQGSHFIYDLCAYPQYVPALREEIVSTLRADGGWKKTTLNKLRKMDSFIKESQRLNPPLFLSFQRVAKKPLTLSDGTYIPTGTHFAMASDAILHDADNLPGGGDPEVFDAFRYAKLREDPSKPENANKFQFAMSDNTHLHFGHGKYACPGRFFASNEVKMILCHLLLGYDFKFPEGQGRPKNLSYEEAQYPDPSVWVLIKKRKLTAAEADVADLIGMKA